ncbi:MAG: hypothetical protein ACOX3T_07330 [Bdellovibrionota bacterium]
MKNKYKKSHSSRGSVLSEMAIVCFYYFALTWVVTHVFVFVFHIVCLNERNLDLLIAVENRPVQFVVDVSPHFMVALREYCLDGLRDTDVPNCESVRGKTRSEIDEVCEVPEVQALSKDCPIYM